MFAHVLLETLMDQVWSYVLDDNEGDTFTIDISSARSGNTYEYADVERVRLRSLSTPELHAPGGQAARDRRRRKIGGKRAQLDIYSRGPYKRLMADVDGSLTWGRR